MAMVVPHRAPAREVPFDEAVLIEMAERCRSQKLRMGIDFLYDNPEQRDIIKQITRTNHSMQPSIHTSVSVVEQTVTDWGVQKVDVAYFNTLATPEDRTSYIDGRHTSIDRVVGKVQVRMTWLGD